MEGPAGSRFIPRVWGTVRLLTRFRLPQCRPLAVTGVHEKRRRA